jgi:glycerol-3-phosphate dehydrogenase
MKRNPAALADTQFDLLVIGGGIFGAGIARDAALRGLRVALVEKGDFASGTSSQSSKLIHGGFRYLEQYQFGLVAEALRERHILRTVAPHLVHPLPLILPVYARDPRPLWKLRAGMKLYNLLALYRNVESSRGLSPAAVLEREPTLRPEGLTGGVRFFDAHEDDARLCLDVILHAARLGAECVNYCPLVTCRTELGRIEYATVEDQLDARLRFKVKARMYVNAAGAWADHLQRQTHLPPTTLRLRPTKGVHLVLPALAGEHGIFFQARRDGRMLFLLPWQGGSLLGTTDTDYDGDFAQAAATAEDVDYLLGEVNALLPSARVGRDDVITTTVGIRPLLADESSPSARPRKHRIVRDGENLLSVGGGKYTTFRAIAEEVVNQVCTILGTRRPCRTATEPLPNLRPPPSGEIICENPKVSASDVEHAVREESATSVLDVMRRRTPLALTRFGGPETAAAVARLMASAAGWNDRQMRESLEEYLAEWQSRRNFH